MSESSTEKAKSIRTKKFHAIEDIETMRVLSNPVRWEILDAAGALGECSAAEIAEFTARARTSLYPHIQQLVESGLLFESSKRLMGKRYEQLYKPVATMMGTRFDRDDPENLEYHISYGKALARLIGRKHERSAVQEDVQPRTAQRNHHCGGHCVWVDEDELAELNAMIDKIWRFCEKSRPGDGKQLLHIGMFLSKHIPKEGSSGDSEES